MGASFHQKSTFISSLGNVSPLDWQCHGTAPSRRHHYELYRIKDVYQHVWDCGAYSASPGSQLLYFGLV